MPDPISQSTAVRIPLYAVQSADHITPATGITIAVTISRNGAAFGNPSAGATNATSIGSGWYYADLSTTDTATLGPVIVLGTGTGIDNVTMALLVIPALTVAGIADGILDRDMSVGTDSGSPSVRTVRQALRFLRNKWSITTGTLTVTKEDDSTTSWTAAITTTAGNPVSSSDPA